MTKNEMKKDIHDTIKEAELILTELNGKIQGKCFSQVCKEEWFNKLNRRIHSLGWLTLLESLKSKTIGGKKILNGRLKLVDPKSDEARDFI